jgi:hypothetical protein
MRLLRNHFRPATQYWPNFTDGGWKVTMTRDKMAANWKQLHLTAFVSDSFIFGTAQTSKWRYVVPWKCQSRLYLPPCLPHANYTAVRNTTILLH